MTKTRAAAKSQSPKEPNPYDVVVGSRLRTMRIKKASSQEQLADALGLTFQQVQKYEKGSNRISASRLIEICKVLDCDTRYFFEGLVEGNAGPLSLGDKYLATREGHQLFEAMAKIKEAPLRRKIVDMAELLAK